MKIIDMPVSKRNTILKLKVGKALEITEEEHAAYKRLLTKLNSEFKDRRYSLISVGNGIYAAGRKK